MKKYKDRKDAGKTLTRILAPYSKKSNLITLALPRGGVPVAYEIAKAIHSPLDIFIVRKLGVPGHEELALGALASGGAVIYNQELINQLNIEKNAIEPILQIEKQELSRRESVYRGNKAFPELLGKTVLLVDDGIATGASIKAAIKGLRLYKPKCIIVAVPVAPLSICKEIEDLADIFICPLKPIDFYAVGLWYQEFSQTTDEEVISLLKSETT
jgi:predicted phosphoribosyltransferase